MTQDDLNRSLKIERCVQAWLVELSPAANLSGHDAHRLISEIDELVRDMIADAGARSGSDQADTPAT